MAAIDRTIVVMGNYRCGTTWLMEMLANGLPGYAGVFEPIRAYFKTMSDAGITQWRPYITTDNATPQKLLAMDDALTGNICRKEKLMRTDRDAVLAAEGVVVKFVRGLMSLGWIMKTFPIRHTFVIQRHPCAAIASQLRVGAVKGTPKTMDELEPFFEHHPEIERFEPKSDVEWLATWWAASYYAAFNQAKPRPWTLLKYELLCQSPGTVRRDVFGPLKETPEDSFKLVSTLSSTAKSWSTGEPTPWKDYLGARASEVWDVTERFPLITVGYNAP